MEITQDIRYVGVNDHQVDLFEGQYVVPNGMAYNSYVILDEKIAVMDTVDIHFKDEWLSNLAEVLGEKKPDYLIIQHLEPDHSANLMNFMKVYPETTIVSNEKAFEMIHKYFELPESTQTLTVGNGETLSLGKHVLTFVFAPMVHWPEVMVTYDSTDRALFSADGFGKFGANDVEESWDDEARRYFIGIVGKYGMQVQNLLKAAATLDIQVVCPLHGPVLKEDLGHYIGLYDKWSSYTPEEEGIIVAYTSVYGHTREAVEFFTEKLREKGAPKVVVYDLARDDMSAAVADAFRYNKLVLATTTYNAGIFPFMRDFILHLTDRNFQNRKVAFIENGTWSPAAARIMKDLLRESYRMDYAKNTVTIHAAMKPETEEALDQLAEELCFEYLAQNDATADKQNMTALFRIGYGLYVVTCHDGQKDNGLIVNTVTQISDNPNRVAVNINKRNYSHDVIRQTGKLNVNCLSVEAPFSTFQRFGFQSGRDADKFEGMEVLHSDNGIAFLPQYANAMMSLVVEDYIDFGTHGMFVCSVSEARVLSTKDTMTYTYYQQNVKPKPQTEGKTGWVCTVCGYIYEGEELSADFICPLCKHGVIDFEKLG